MVTGLHRWRTSFEIQRYGLTGIRRSCRQYDHTKRPDLSGRLQEDVLEGNYLLIDFNRQALRLRRLASSGDRLGVASSYESGRRRVDGKTAIREGRYVTLRRDRGRSACGGPNSPTRILPLYSPR